MRYMILPFGAVALAFYIISVIGGQIFPARAETYTFETEVECLAVTMYWEGARGDATDQAAIAQNVLNRTLEGNYGWTVCEVVNQAKLVRGRKVAQYSYTTDNRPHPSTQKPAHYWAFSQFLAENILRDWLANGRDKKVFAEARQRAATSTHYHTPAVTPRWSVVDVEKCRLKPLGQIGAHLHYAEYALSDPEGQRRCRLERAKKN